jgi:glycosyltransferase involved in cell wall biosynthesis
MRILVISNLYPPHFIGGYELGCKDIVARLESRGHDIRVLTSTYGLDRRESEDGVYRYLQLDLGRPPGPPGLTYLLRREQRNQKAFHRICKAFQPEIIYLWNLIHLSPSIAVLAERSGVPVVYFVSDKHWTRLGSPDVDPWLNIVSRSFPNPKPTVRAGVTMLRGALNTLGLIHAGELTFPRIHFVSDFLKQEAIRAGRQAAHGEVIRWGVDLKRFTYQPPADRDLRLVYVGQITEGKGFGTAIEVMRRLVHQPGRASLSMTIVGDSIAPDYLAEMKKLVRARGLQENVLFAGPAARERLPDIYREHDILLFPSLLDEALSITTLEALACGLPVVATATGGNVEVMRHEFNALIFPKGDAVSAASHVSRVLDDRELFKRLSQNGRRTAEDGFDLEKMVDQIEHSLTIAAE